MEVFDVRNKVIDIGYPARYLGTGTNGKVDDVKVEDDATWVKFEDSDLWYNTKDIEVLNPDEYHEKGEIKLDKREALEKIKEMNDVLSNHNADDDVCGGGG